MFQSCHSATWLARCKLSDFSWMLFSRWKKGEAESLNLCLTPFLIWNLSVQSLHSKNKEIDFVDAIFLPYYFTYFTLIYHVVVFASHCCCSYPNYHNLSLVKEFNSILNKEYIKPVQSVARFLLILFRAITLNDWLRYCSIQYGNKK